MQNYFQLFQLPQVFTINLEKLEKAYHNVQSQVHPDKFTCSSSLEKRVAIQLATHANEAYEVLKNPLKRAVYLCELNGINLHIDSNTTMSNDFLVQQIDLYEALYHAKTSTSAEELNKIEKKLYVIRENSINTIAKLLDTHSFSKITREVKQLMFLEKLNHEIDIAYEIFEK